MLEKLHTAGGETSLLDKVILFHPLLLLHGLQTYEVKAIVVRENSAVPRQRKPQLCCSTMLAEFKAEACESVSH